MSPCPCSAVGCWPVAGVNNGALLMLTPDQKGTLSNATSVTLVILKNLAKYIYRMQLIRNAAIHSTGTMRSTNSNKYSELNELTKCHWSIKRSKGGKLLSE